MGRQSTFSRSLFPFVFPFYYLLFLLHSCLFLAPAFSGFLTLSLSWDLSRSPTCWAGCFLVCTTFTAHPHFLPVTPCLQLLAPSSPSASSLLTFFSFLFPHIHFFVLMIDSRVSSTTLFLSPSSILHLFVTAFSSFSFCYSFPCWYTVQCCLAALSAPCWVFFLFHLSNYTARRLLYNRYCAISPSVDPLWSSSVKGFVPSLFLIEPCTLPVSKSIGFS